MLGFKTFKTAKITLAGIELAHRIRKGQFLLADRNPGQSSLKLLWKFALYPAEDNIRSTSNWLCRLAGAKLQNRKNNK